MHEPAGAQEHKHSSRGRSVFSRQPGSAGTMFRSRWAPQSALTVGNVVSILGVLARWTQNTTSQNWSTGTTSQNLSSQNLCSQKLFQQPSEVAAVHVAKPGSHMAMLWNIRSCFEFHCLPRSSSHRSNIVLLFSGLLLLCKFFPQTVLTHTFFS